MSGTQNPFNYQYETVAASQTAQVLGGTGAVGDNLHRIVVNVTTTLTSAFSILDGATTVLTVANSVLANGVYSIEFNAASQSGAWKVTTGAGVTVIGIGKFTQ